MKNCNEAEVQLHILNLNTRLRQVVSPFPSQDPLDTKLGVSQSSSGHWKKRILAIRKWTKTFQSCNPQPSIYTNQAIQAMSNTNTQLKGTSTVGSKEQNRMRQNYIVRSFNWISNVETDTRCRMQGGIETHNRFDLAAFKKQFKKHKPNWDKVMMNV